MIRMDGHDIWRDSSKIGWIDGIYLHAHDGTKLGYFQDRFIFDLNGKKVAYIQGDYLYSATGSDKVSLDKISEQVTGGVIPDIAKCAIYTLF
jgi:hypothetical protein